MKWNSVILCIGVLLATSEVFGIDSLRTEVRKGKYFVVHQVESGETLYSISRRYQSEAKKIIRANKIKDNYINVGDVLDIPIEVAENTLIEEPRTALGDGNEGSKDGNGKIHVVEAGQTMYSLSRQYGVSVDDLVKWNNMDGYGLAIGQQLIVGAGDMRAAELRKLSESVAENQHSGQMGSVYFVQVGESLSSIARKFDVAESQLWTWNNLRTNKVEIGQKITFPFEIDMDSVALATEADRPDLRSTGYGSKIGFSEAGGIKRFVEEGIVKRIETDDETDKYLALHRSLSIGTVFQVKNLMNNRIIHVRVVGQLPDTGINQKVMIRMTSSAFKELDILDDRARVEIVYFNE
ncbi:MAG: LysM peptidoglycan-binding domain-containing protein [Cyclobacteriaceae bacterium]